MNVFYANLVPKLILVTYAYHMERTYELDKLVARM